MFRKKLLAFIRPLGNDTYGIYDPLGIRLVNRLHLGFSHLREPKFRYNFADTLNPLCSCSLETEDTEHYFQRCQNNLLLRTTLINDLNNIITAIASLNSNDLLRVILYSDESFKDTSCIYQIYKRYKAFYKIFLLMMQIIINLLQLISK